MGRGGEEKGRILGIEKKKNRAIVFVFLQNERPLRARIIYKDDRYTRVGVSRRMSLTTTVFANTACVYKYNPKHNIPFRSRKINKTENLREEDGENTYTHT